jgi:hypothetical protein
LLNRIYDSVATEEIKMSADSRSAPGTVVTPIQNNIATGTVENDANHSNYHAAQTDHSVTKQSSARLGIGDGNDFDGDDDINKYAEPDENMNVRIQVTQGSLLVQSGHVGTLYT